MSKIAKKDDVVGFLKPRSTVNDKFKVYDRSFTGNTQFDSVQRKGGEREIFIDPEVIFRMATLGLDQGMIAGYWGMSKAKFKELCEEYPDLEEVYLMGMTAGIANAAQALEEMVREKQMVPVLFRLKVGGFIEKEKLIGKESNQENAARVNIYLPSNGRDDIMGDPDE